jgi:hypothetical protein
VKYTKPQATILGDACALVEGCNKQECIGDGSVSLPSDAPAYELDE